MTDRERAATFVGLPSIFAECVRESLTKFFTDVPFVQGEYVYATSGAIAVRRPVASVPAATVEMLEGLRQADGRHPPQGLAAIFDGDKWDSEPTTIPDVNERVVCDNCGGTGMLCTTEKHGFDFECDVCDGDGYRDDSTAVALSETYHIQSHFLARLRRHGATECWLPRNRGNTSPMRVSTPGWEAIVMPLNLGRNESRPKVQSGEVGSCR